MTGTWNDKDRLRVLYVAYPLLPVSEHSAGGAEQVLWSLEREMRVRGHGTAVAACSGSEIAGELFATGAPATTVDQFEERSQNQARLVLEWLQSGAAQFHLIHDMSGSFWAHCGAVPVPVLSTLHLPRSLYTQVDFSSLPANVSFNCVSEAQAQEFSDLSPVLGIARNGIALDRFPTTSVPSPKREYLLWIGRICEEKGPHIALDVAHKAGKKLIVAGTVYPFLYHQKYFAREVIPRLKRAASTAKYVERPTFGEKIDLIRNAEAVLITSEINETSSMVAMEAAACSTPVIALRRGALPEIVEPGITGFLAADLGEMIATLPRLSEIDVRGCRRYAEGNYSAVKMAAQYHSLYQRLLSKGTLT